MTKRKRATKEELRAEIKELRTIGRQMANVMFNLRYSTDLLDPHAHLIQQWDAIKRREPHL